MIDVSAAIAEYMAHLIDLLWSVQYSMAPVVEVHSIVKNIDVPFGCMMLWYSLESGDISYPK